MLNVVIIQLVLLTAAVPSTECSTDDEGGEVMNRHRGSDPDDSIHARLHYGLLNAIRSEEARQRARNNLETVTSTVTFICNPETVDSTERFICNSEAISSTEKFICTPEMDNFTERSIFSPETISSTESNIHSLGTLNSNNPFIEIIRINMFEAIDFIQAGHRTGENSGTANSPRDLSAIHPIAVALN